MSASLLTHPQPRTDSSAQPPPESLGQRAWVAISGAFAAVLGLLPHVLHHASPLAVFAVVFSLSTFVTGPAIGGDSGADRATPTQQTPQPPAPASQHEQHHR